ncbi:hypothetical protein K7432_011607 [Basidiobolus ranarum]|uniref:Uncharacterized protein n=1 Tax=Basidiobolus ranarum TaxID=34480 RepID=A0ABR2VTN1_9FUNG
MTACLLTKFAIDAFMTNNMKLPLIHRAIFSTLPVLLKRSLFKTLDVKTSNLIARSVLCGLVVIIVSLDAGAATVLNAIYEQECALITFSSGVITRDYKYSCCGASTWIRVNLVDWEKLREAEKLDGFRYQLVTFKDNTYSINFRKMNGKTPGNISPEEFLP